MSQWALYWADGRRTVAEIADALSWEKGGLLRPGATPTRKPVEAAAVAGYFEALAELGYVELPEREQMVTRPQLVADLRRLGVTPGMDLMVHSSLSRIGAVEGGAETVVDALLEAIGRKGTLLMPSFNHRAAQVYNRLATPTTNGAIPDAFWRRPQAVRSEHATHAVAAMGPRAERMCTNHLEAGCWEPESPIGQLVHEGGWVLALGATHWTTTAYHVAEMSVPCRCIDPFGDIHRVVREAGTVEQVWGLAFRWGACPVQVAPKLDKALDRRGLQRRGLVGAAECELTRAEDLFKVRREHLKPVCPTCKVRPNYKQG
jgi:aminoglycoside N3'-acetyltransferase